jgi:hypothetical protein
MLPQLLVHFWADYVFQSSWMALNKNKHYWPCIVHIIIYTSCFLSLTTSWKALLVIGGTHFLIDRFSLARFVIFGKEQILNPKDWRHDWLHSNTTGYYDRVRTMWAKTAIVEDRPEQVRPYWMTIWLCIVVDNLFHLTINYLALAHL